MDSHDANLLFIIVMMVAFVVLVSIPFFTKYHTFSALSDPQDNDSVCAGCDQHVTHDVLKRHGLKWHRDCWIPPLDTERQAALVACTERYATMNDDALMAYAMRRVFHDDWRIQKMCWRVIHHDSAPDREAMNDALFEARSRHMDELLVINAVLCDHQARRDLLLAALSYDDLIERQEEDAA